MDVYDHPRAYELAFAYRDIAGECEGLLLAAERSLGRPAVSAVELAAGPALHARELARRGLRVAAVDRSAGALAYVAAVAPAIATVQADLRDFVLSAPVDLAFCPLSGFAYLLDDAAWHAALTAAAAALVPGGALVLELAPADATRAVADAWTANDGARTVHAYAGPSEPLDGDTCRWELRVTLDGVTFSGWQHQRALSAAAAERLVASHGAFGAVRAWSGYDQRRRYRGGDTLVLTAQKARGPA